MYENNSKEIDCGVDGDLLLRTVRDGVQQGLPSSGLPYTFIFTKTNNINCFHKQHIYLWIINFYVSNYFKRLFIDINLKERFISWTDKKLVPDQELVP